ncbi:MAG: DNA/RNA non-specific endonuclease, partial [Myxococcales bacterium]|nr:DNA/RNA non-specific endonuclease [Myxococcales bacterium]
VDAANQELLLNGAERARALATHLPFGEPPPRTEHQRLRVLKQFVIQYDPELRGPIWTAYRLEPQDVVEAERLDAFRADPLLDPDVRAECRDYEEPIFDTGHLVPRADMNRSESAMLNTFLLSNMTPQHCATNRGPWLVLEDLVRQWAAKGPLLIYSGAVYDWYAPEGQDPPEQVPRMHSPRYPEEMGEVRRVAVPSHLFKIVVRLHPAGVHRPYEGLAFLIRNSPRKVPKQRLKSFLQKALVAPGTLQRLTGVRFFPRLHRDALALKEALLSRKAETLWDYEQLTPQLTGRCKDDYADY